MILFLHNRYRHAGGEERAVDDLRWLVREHLGEDAELLDARLRRARSRACGGGHAARRAGPRRGRATAVRRTGARVVHAHNVNPSLGWRALAAAREAGARVVLHLHNYRLVCAVGTCFNPREEDCTRCHGRDTRPGVRLNCRGTGAEALVYARVARRSGSGGSSSRPTRSSCPSAFAVERLRALGAPLGDTPIHVVPQVQRAFAERSRGRGRAATRSSPRGWPSRRASRSPSRPARAPGCRSSSPATARAQAEVAGRARAPTCASPAA